MLLGQLVPNGQVFNRNLISEEQITSPPAPLALRLLGHLLLGVCRVWTKKGMLKITFPRLIFQVEYLYADASEAFVKIKMVPPLLEFSILNLISWRPFDLHLLKWNKLVLTSTLLLCLKLMLTLRSTCLLLYLPSMSDPHEFLDFLLLSLLHEAEDGLLSLNIARAVDITMHAEPQMSNGMSQTEFMSQAFQVRNNKIP